MIHNDEKTLTSIVDRIKTEGTHNLKALFEHLSMETTLKLMKLTNEYAVRTSNIDELTSIDFIIWCLWDSNDQDDNYISDETRYFFDIDGDIYNEDETINASVDDIDSDITEGTYYTNVDRDLEAIVHRRVSTEEVVTLDEFLNLTLSLCKKQSDILLTQMLIG